MTVINFNGNIQSILSIFNILWHMNIKTCIIKKMVFINILVYVAEILRGGASLFLI